ncbi:MAG: sensor histidine kinase [Bacillota bacterium]
MKKRPSHGMTAIAIILIVLNLSQVALIAAILLYITGLSEDPGLLKNPWVIALLLVILAVVIINSLVAIRNRSSTLRSIYQFRMLEDTLSRLETLNSTLRAQRHDFLNHLQVVYSLMEMEEYHAAAEYIEKVYDDIQKVSKILKTSNAAVNALLQAKLLTCEDRGIKVELNVTTQLKDLKIPSWEFCRVLGNLLDNAIYALREKEGDKLVKIDLYEDLKYYYFRVSDNGIPIPEELHKKIFEAGFTTKGGEGEGMGLPISAGIMEKYGGSLSLSCEGEYKVFEGKAPR